MAFVVDITEKVPENKLFEQIKIASDFGALVATAVNDKHGTFTLEVISLDDDGGAGDGITFNGKMSTFGGPTDPDVKPDEGLALFDPPDVANNPDLFLPQQPPGTTGLAKRLNPDARYLACRWTYSVTPKSFLKAKTTQVKVTNSANNKSAMARPADWGPADFTERVADLSPGLATELGLDTNQFCRVEVPLPGGTTLPSLGTGVAAEFDLLTIEQSVLLPGMARTLVVLTTSNKATYWVVSQVDSESGGQTLLRHANGATEVLLGDTTVFPVKPSDKIPEAVADELNKAAPERVVPETGPAGNPPQPGEDINAKMFQAAKDFVDHDTSHVPDTQNGNLACAWAVNEVTRRALGKPISADSRGNNGLRTIDLFEALRAHHTQLGSASEAVPGTIIIAPTEGSRHGHVGIVGARTGSVANTDVYSNKSKPGVFKRNFTIGSFTETYTGPRLHLRVLFFALKRDFFA
jgi:hypothetical protein